MGFILLFGVFLETFIQKKENIRFYYNKNTPLTKFCRYAIL